MTAQGSGSLLSPVTNLASGVVGSVTSLLSGVVNLVVGLVGGIGNVLQTAAYSVQLNFVLIPKVDSIVNSIQQKIPTVLADLTHADFKYPFFQLNRDSLREQALLKSGTVPLTRTGLQTENKAVNDLSQRFNQISAEYYQFYVQVISNCSLAQACSNTSIQVANCSCYATSEVSQLINDYYNIYVPLKQQDLVFYKAAIAKDYNYEVENPETIKDFIKIVDDIQAVYEYIYQNNGQVDETLVATNLTRISSDINALASTYPESIESAAYTGEY